MPSINLNTASIVDIGRAIETREISARDVLEHLAKRREAMEPSIHAFLDDGTGRLLAHSGRTGPMDGQGRGDPILAGVPISLKDNICVKGWKTTCASVMLEEFVPPYSATVVEKIGQAGMLVDGKCNMDEFAMGSTSETSAFGAVRNPFSTAHSPGGSSGGSAAAVASGMSYCALGSDTGGSVRQPAGFCGVTGLKPTYGSVSRYGLIAYASSLDQIGPIARSVPDCAALFDVIGGPDAKDSTCIAPTPTGHYGTLDAFLRTAQDRERPLEGHRIGLLADMHGEGVCADVRRTAEETIRTLESLGAVCEEVAMPDLRFSVPAYYIIACAEASSNLSRYDGIRYGSRAQDAADLADLYRRTRTGMFGDEVIRRIMLGSFVLSSGYFDAYYKKALQVRALVKNGTDAILQRFDAILMPVSPVTAPRIGESLDDPLAMYLNDIFTVSANLTGMPAIAFPCGFGIDGLPVGMQLMAGAFCEDVLFRIAGIFQQRTEFHRRIPYPTEHRGGANP